MSTSPSSSPFKYVFIGLLLLAGFQFTGAWTLFDARLLGMPRPLGHPLLLMPVVVFFFVYVPLVGLLVYRDAARRGMDPWMWAAVATFTPLLIGVIIYLVMRAEGRGRCANCGKPVHGDFRLCPYCGQIQRLKCPGCQGPLADEWKVCPQCGHDLRQAE